MGEKHNNKGFWDHYAGLYDFEINRFSGKAYEKMYRLMADVLTSDMDILEIATGTGLIALNIAVKPAIQLGNIILYFLR